MLIFGGMDGRGIYRMDSELNIMKYEINLYNGML